MRSNLSPSSLATASSWVERWAFFPSSMGLSALVPAQVDELAVRARWGDYERVEDAEDGGGMPWQRRPRSAATSVTLSPTPPEVDYWVGVEVGESSAQDPDIETTKFWQASDARTPVGVALSADLGSLHILHEDDLVIVTDTDDDRVGDVEDGIALGATALAGPVVNGTGVAFLVAAPEIELWTYDTDRDASQPQWRAEGSLGAGALALATAGARDTYLISEPSAGVIWRLDTQEGTLERFYSAPAEQLPSRSLSYREADGLVWIPGAGMYETTMKLALDRNHDGQILDGDTDTDMILFADSHCAMPINAGIGQVGDWVVWSNYGCGDSVFLLTPENTQASVTPDGNLPIAIAAAPDPCQRTRDPRPRRTPVPPA